LEGQLTSALFRRNPFESTSLVNSSLIQAFLFTEIPNQQLIRIYNVTKLNSKNDLANFQEIKLDCDNQNFLFYSYDLHVLPPKYFLFVCKFNPFVVKLFNIENTSIELDAKAFDKKITASYTNIYNNKIICIDSKAVQTCRLFLILVFEKKEIHLYEIKNEKLEIIKEFDEKDLKAQVNESLEEDEEIENKRIVFDSNYVLNKIDNNFDSNNKLKSNVYIRFMACFNEEIILDISVLKEDNDLNFRIDYKRHVISDLKFYDLIGNVLGYVNFFDEFFIFDIGLNSYLSLKTALFLMKSSFEQVHRTSKTGRKKLANR
jgi:hypothetical protein